MRSGTSIVRNIAGRRILTASVRIYLITLLVRGKTESFRKKWATQDAEAAVSSWESERKKQRKSSSKSKNAGTVRETKTEAKRKTRRETRTKSKK